MRKIVISLFLVAFLSGCYESVIYTTNHPDEGSVVVDIDTSFLSDDEDAPESYTILIAGQEVVVTDNQVEFPSTLEPGDYTVYVYNNPETLAIESTTDSATGETSVVVSAPTSTDGVLGSIDETFYFGSQDITLSSDAVTSSGVSMNQIVGELYIELEIDGDAYERIEGASASINGIAQQWDCVSDSPIGESATIEPALTQEIVDVSTKASSDVKYLLCGTINILGVSATDKQELNIELSYKDSNPVSHTVESDITDQLSSFNDDKSTSTTLGGTLYTPTSSSSGGVIIDCNLKNEDVVIK